MSSETASLWASLWHLLRETEPKAGSYDVEWVGPYYISRPRQWHRSGFMLYRGTLFGFLEVGWSNFEAQWDLASGDLAYDARGASTWAGGARPTWERAVPQLVHRLESAVAHPDAFNARVRRLLPLEARTGVIKRRWSWPRRTRAPLASREFVSLEAACRRGGQVEPLASLTAAEYLALAGFMYDAAFPEIVGLSPRGQRARKADTRHGGMLDLQEDDPDAFREWYASSTWAGSHPWEIVFGHPHGILLFPRLDGRGRWRLLLRVECLGLYLPAVRMAIALGERCVPFELQAKETVVAALRGLDDVAVGPGYGRMSLEELRERRPEGLVHVRWDPVPEIRPITPPQRRRVEHVLTTGSPAGWLSPESASKGAPTPS